MTRTVECLFQCKSGAATRLLHRPILTGKVQRLREGGKRLGAFYPSFEGSGHKVEPLFQLLRTQKASHYGRPTAKKLVALAQQSVSSERAIAGRSVSLRILCDQLEHTQANLARLCR